MKQSEVQPPDGARATWWQSNEEREVIAERRHGRWVLVDEVNPDESGDGV